MLFVDRELELKYLEELWMGGRPEFIVVYGRRRVGKTWLLKRFCSGKKGVYFHSLPLSHEYNLARLSRAIESSLGLRGFSNISFNTLYDLLYRLVREIGFDNRIYVVLDEFTYWARSAPRVIGELQEFIDHVFSDTRLFLVVCGSLVGVMYRGVLSSSSPLYGRRTGVLYVKPFKPWFVRDFVRLDAIDRVRVYGLIGGIPYYLSLASRYNSLGDIVKGLFLSPVAPLLYEPLFILREEFREPHVYMSILSAIAHGHNTPSKIASVTGVHRQHVSKYLSILVELGIIRHVVPLEARRGWYVVSDHLFRTWFSLIEPILDYVESSEYGKALGYVLERIDEHTSFAWEDIVYQYILGYGERHGIVFDKIGKYVYRGVEIDYVAVNRREKTVYPIEVKWSRLDKADTARIISKLYSKIMETPWRSYSIKPVIVAVNAPKDTSDAIVVTLENIPV